MSYIRCAFRSAAYALLFGLVTACTQSGGSGAASGGEARTSASELPNGLMLGAMPAEARSVAEAKGKVAAGEHVTIRGRIGGSAQPFVEGRAAFTIVDAQLKACSDIPGDRCPKPWDYCCESKDSLARNMATVSVVDDAGKPLPTTLRGANGLRELSDVVIVGKVAQAEGNVLLINAEGIYVVAP